MPLYDLTCGHCKGIFERLLPASRLHALTSCPYCGKETAAAPMMNGARVGLRVVDTWKPRSKSEQLAGSGVAGPGTEKGARRSSVLHNCKGFNCSVCET